RDNGPRIHRNIVLKGGIVTDNRVRVEMYMPTENGVSGKLHTPTDNAALPDLTNRSNRCRWMDHSLCLPSGTLNLTVDCQFGLWLTYSDDKSLGFEPFYYFMNRS